ncbi:TniQ family protein [Geodermatophilus sp. DSM 44513]|uniref:TniQ family protein n=1 Tax=Geodermatophilus sp. DSM 44513 TaxID=1528104 RepID=UPI0028F70294|nr:TniQ family protein [Geodermatophilus sp. DSM 44513]WNV77877.1 TniQ family protein [Geodermatophilus sp. DSM 44513]
MAGRFAHACNLTATEAVGLTLARWDGLLFDMTTPGKAARTAQGNGWFVPTLTRACPQCLADVDPQAPDRVTWQAAWKTPWAVACTRHGILLEDTCTGCGQPFGATGTRIPSLIPNAAFEPLHPAACRARPTGSGTLCGHRIDHLDARTAPHLVVALQERLDGLLDGSRTQACSLGVPVSAAQYLRDLRAIAVLLQLADHRRPLAPLPSEFTEALAAHLDARNERRATRRENDRTDRTWTEPPTSTHVLASLLHQAAAVLDLPAPEDARGLLPPLVEAANERERLAWGRIRSAAQPSDGLFRYFAPNRSGTFSVHMLRAACTATLTITSDQAPAYLEPERYERWFATFDPSEQRNIRRAVPIAITQLVEDCDLDTAADRLGTPRVSAQAALIRAGRACKRTDRDDEFRRLIGLAAEDLQAHPIDYGHRRRHLNAAWNIPEPDWQHLREAMLAARVARKDTPWEQRRTDLRIWLWSEITSGDPALAPMIQTESAARRSTDLAISSYSTLRRRAVPALEQIVTKYAEGLAASIDAHRPDRDRAATDLPFKRSLDSPAA